MSYFTSTSPQTPPQTPPRSPPGTPQIRNRTINNYIQNKSEELQNAITKLKNSNSNNAFREFNINFSNMRYDSRTTGVNPNNALFIDEINKKVYKIGLWNMKSLSIRNEYIAYKKIALSANSHQYKHTPKMNDCKLIPGTKYALLIITYKEGLNYINTEEDHLFKEGQKFLKKLGINHHDLLGNIFEINLPNIKTFFIIDFEDCTFRENLENNTNLINMDTKVQNITETNRSRRSRLFLNSPGKQQNPSKSLFGSNNINTPPKKPRGLFRGGKSKKKNISKKK